MLNITIQGEYSELFGKKAPTIKQLIPDNISEGCLVALSMISYSDRGGELNQICEKRLPLSKKGKRKIHGVKINKRPSNLILWVELLKRNLKPLDINKFKFENYIKDVVEPLSAINEKEAVGNDDSLYLLKNLLYTYQDNSLFQYYRSVNIFIHDDLMKKYQDQFNQAYGISIKDYIFICHAINAIYSQTQNWTSANHWIFNAEAFSRLEGFNSEKVKKVIDLISFTQADLRKYSKSEDYDNHNFSFFSNSPFFDMGNGCYIPVDGKLAQNLVFNSLFYRFKKSVRDKKAFMRDYGLSFEKYAINLTKYVANNSKSFKYTSIPEFKYGTPEKHSSDAYICFKGEHDGENAVLVFEVKSARILDDVKRLQGNRDSVEKSIRKLTINPLEQQVKVTSELVQLGCHPEITKDKVYYFISISMDDFPLLVGDFDSEINSEALEDLKFGGLYSFNIEELELFCKLTSNDLEWPSTYLLEKYRVDHSNLSFKTFLSRLESASGFKNALFEKKVLDSQETLVEYLRSNLDNT